MAATLDGTVEAPLRDGEIELDSPRGTVFGFTSDKYGRGSYLWKDGDRIYISFIETVRKGQGFLSALFKAIEEAGFRVAVPTPLPRMEAILRRKGFVMHQETTEGGELCDVWERSL